MARKGVNLLSDDEGSEEERNEPPFGDGPETSKPPPSHGKPGGSTKLIRIIAYTAVVLIFLAAGAGGTYRLWWVPKLKREQDRIEAKKRLEEMRKKHLAQSKLEEERRRKEVALLQEIQKKAEPERKAGAGATAESPSAAPKPEPGPKEGAKPKEEEAKASQPPEVMAPPPPEKTSRRVLAAPLEGQPGPAAPEPSAEKKPLTSAKEPPRPARAEESAPVPPRPARAEESAPAPPQPPKEEAAEKPAQAQQAPREEPSPAAEEEERKVVATAPKPAPSMTEPSKPASPVAQPPKPEPPAKRPQKQAVAREAKPAERARSAKKKPSPSAPSANGKYYSVQVATCRTDRCVKAFVDKLRNEKFKPYVSGGIAAPPMNEVLLGTFSSRAEAEGFIELARRRSVRATAYKAGKSWRVSAGAFTELEHAAQRLDQVEDAGLKGEISPHPRSRRSFRVVRTGRVRTQQEANELRGRLLRAGFSGSFVVQRKTSK